MYSGNRALAAPIPTRALSDGLISRRSVVLCAQLGTAGRLPRLIGAGISTCDHILVSNLEVKAGACNWRTIYLRDGVVTKTITQTCPLVGTAHAPIRRAGVVARRETAIRVETILSRYKPRADCQDQRNRCKEPWE